MKRTAAAAAVILAFLASDAGVAQARVAPLRLQGKFTMHGTVTTDDDVLGEQPGERLRRNWNFFPQCATGTCRRVLLKRRRGGRHILNLVMLARRPSGLYVGDGSFWVPLRCAGQVERHGGLATETITVRITKTQLVGATRFATAISATYTNPSRVNLTRCPGEIGHDGARYSGHLASPLPGPPTAGFTATPDLATPERTPRAPPAILRCTLRRRADRRSAPRAPGYTCMDSWIGASRAGNCGCRR